jgi:hypothetical protein
LIQPGEFHLSMMDGSHYDVLIEAGLSRFITKAPCLVHTNHTPQSHINEVHHIWPLGMKGPDIPANRIVICATGHNNVHDLLSSLVRNNGFLAGDTLRRYGKADRRLAMMGYLRWKNGDVNVIVEPV